MTASKAKRERRRDVELRRTLAYQAVDEDVWRALLNVVDFEADAARATGAAWEAEAYHRRLDQLLEYVLSDDVRRAVGAILDAELTTRRAAWDKRERERVRQLARRRRK
jgi:hypothetical protein